MGATIAICALVCAGLVGLAWYIGARGERMRKDMIEKITEEAVRGYFGGYSAKESLALAKKLYGWEEKEGDKHETTYN